MRILKWVRFFYTTSKLVLIFIYFIAFILKKHQNPYR